MPHALPLSAHSSVAAGTTAARRGLRKSATATATTFAPRRPYSYASLDQPSAWERAARTSSAAILDYNRPNPAAVRPVASFPLSRTVPDEPIEHAWQRVDRDAMVYVGVDVDADHIRTIAAPLTEAALLSHIAHSNGVHSRFSHSPLARSAFSFSEISSREMAAAAPDHHADFELVDHAMSSEDMCDSDGLAEDYRAPAAEVAPPGATGAPVAPDRDIDVVVTAPAASAPALASRAAPGSPIECPLMPWEDAAPKPPVCTPEYKKVASQLAEWAADMVMRLVRGQSVDTVLGAPTFDAFGRRTEYGGAPPLLVDNIRYCLMSTLLQPSVVFLAINYVARLPVLAEDTSIDPQASERFRRALFGDSTFEHVSKNETDLYPPFKAFVNGIVLASKTLDDATFTNKVWHDISRIPVADINALERASLDLLGYDLTLPATDWHSWLLVLREAHGYRAPFPAPIGPIRETPHGAMFDVFTKLIGTSEARLRTTGPLFLGIEERIAKRLQVLQHWFIPEDDLDEYSPLRDEYRPRAYNEPRYETAFVLKAAPVDLPPPAEWCPAADPIVARPQRSSGHAAWPPLILSQQEPLVYQSATLIAYPVVDAFGYAMAESQYGAAYVHHHQSAFQPAYYQTCCT